MKQNLIHDEISGNTNEYVIKQEIYFKVLIPIIKQMSMKQMIDQKDMKLK